MRVPWTAGRFNQSILKEISPGVHWKVFIGRTNAEVFIGRTDVLWKDWLWMEVRDIVQETGIKTMEKKCKKAK